MYTTFHIKADELDESFLKALKTMFKKKYISIVVEEDMDETEYLLSSPANRRMLERNLKNAEAGNVKEVNLDKYLKNKK